MFLSRKLFKKCLTFGSALLLSASAWAAGAPGANPLYNPLAILLISVMLILLIVIGVLGNVLIGAADINFLKWKKKQEAEEKPAISKVVAVFVGMLVIRPALFAQEATTNAQTGSTIEGLSPLTFYLMITVVLVELLVILVLLINVRFLITSQKGKLEAVEVKEVMTVKPRISWWSRFNKFKPLEQEGDLDLGHEYDGIRELNNRLPPWWIYGFYLTIIFAAIYLWRYHVSHTAPLSIEEYQIAVQKADDKIKDYLKQKGDAVDENTVTMLGNADVAEGKKIFETVCVSCHSQGGAGNVGPNLTDDYWIHGGDIKNVFKTIKYGINAMPTWQNAYSNKQIAQLASYVKSLHGTKPANAKAPQGDLYKEESSETKPKADSATAKKEDKVVIK